MPSTGGWCDTYHTQLCPVLTMSQEQYTVELEKIQLYVGQHISEPIQELLLRPKIPARRTSPS